MSFSGSVGVTHEPVRRDPRDLWLEANLCNCGAVPGQLNGWSMLREHARKRLTKKAKKAFRGFPAATVAFYARITAGRAS